MEGSYCRYHYCPRRRPRQRHDRLIPHGEQGSGSLLGESQRPALSRLTQGRARAEHNISQALAGSAPSFGIVTSFHFATFEAPPTAIVFSYNYLGLSVSDQVDAFSAYQSFGAASAPAELGISFTIGAGGSIDISGVYYGAEQEFNSYINVLLDKLPEGYETLVTAMSWIESLQSLAGDQNLDTSGGSDSVRLSTSSAETAKIC